MRFRRISDDHSFSLLELMVVIGIIAFLIAVLAPALGPSSGRSLDNSTRQFLADLESARLLAIAHRTRTRILLPITQNPITPATVPVTDLALRAYTVVVFNRVTNDWKQTEKWSRLAQSVAFDPDPIVTATEMSVLKDRKTETTLLDTTNTFTGPYIEFKANGATSLDPADKFEVVVIGDAIVEPNGAYHPKNTKLAAQITVDPLTGSALSK